MVSNYYTFSGGSVNFITESFPNYIVGLNYSIYILLFSFLVLLVSLFVLWFTRYYMSLEFNMSVYIFLMIFFIMSMFGLLFSSSWTLLILSWEMLGVSSYFLINYYSSWESHNNAMSTLLIMRSGEWFFFIILSSGVYFYLLKISFLLLSEVFIIGFMVLCMSKSALWPFSVWLPKAMSAPTPTSSLVHSSTLVTAGLVLMMKFSDLFLTSLVMLLMTYIGLLTMVMGSMLAFMEYSVKKLVAYSTLSQMGLCMLVYGLGNFELGYLNLISHGFAKSLLFMQVGYLIHVSMNNQSWRNWNSSGVINGLVRVQVAASLFSLCGTMFFGGMISKESILMLMNFNSWSFFMLFLLTVSIYFTFFYSFTIYKVFFSSSLTPTLYLSNSVSMIFSTYLELVFVIVHFTWMGMNSVNLYKSFGWGDLMIPLFVIIMVMFSVYFLFNLNLFFSLLFNIFKSLSGIPLISWFANFLFHINWFESWIYSLNLKFGSLLILMSMNTSRLNTFNTHFVILLLILLMFFI